MTYYEKFPKPMRIGIAIFSILFILAATFVTYKFFTRNSGSQSYDPVAVMAISSRGGMCNGGACKHKVFNIYENGDFEGHTKLSSDEVTKLKHLIDRTDFKVYGQNTKIGPRCASYVDGSDRVLYFPQKYGSTPVVPCELDIPVDDQVFNYLNGVIKTHTPVKK